MGHLSINREARARHRNDGSRTSNFVEVIYFIFLASEPIFKAAFLRLSAAREINLSYHC